jgi:putative phage-type endonuclease
MTVTAYATPEAVLIGDFPPGSAEWHAARKNGLGGSEIAAVVGLSKWESAYSTWHRKAGRIGPVEQTEPMRWGHLLEPVIADEFANRHPELLVTPAGTFANVDRRWQIANPDRLVAAQGGVWSGLEIKTARVADGWGPDGSDEIPVYYRAQIQHYMDTLGLPKFYVAVLIGGSEYREYAVPYDENDALILRNAGEAFIASLAAGIPPEPDGSDASYDAALRLSVGVEATAVEIPPGLATSYNSARSAVDDATERRKEASARILAAIGTARYAEVNGLRVAMRTVKADGTTHSLQPARGN